MKKTKNSVYLIALAVLAVFILGLEVWVLRHAMGNADGVQKPAAGKTEQSQSQQNENAPVVPSAGRMLFGGDINLANNVAAMEKLAQAENGLNDCIDPALLEQMNGAELFCVNQEFAFTAAGQPDGTKAYHYGAKSDNVEILKTMGVDLVTLANDRIYDYGEEGLNTTLSVLGEAGIASIGAGQNSAAARDFAAFEVGGRRVAIVNASQAEQQVRTPAAGDGQAGILDCYDTAALTEAIRSARSAADYVVCCVHWGLEYNQQANAPQQVTAHACIDAGADLIVGTHPHVLQQVEYYQGKPIFYSLGSLWFGTKTVNTCLLAVDFPEEAGEPTLSLIPAVQSDCTTMAADDSQKTAVFQQVQTASEGVTVSETGVVTAAVVGAAPEADAELPEEEQSEAVPAR